MLSDRAKAKFGSLDSKSHACPTVLCFCENLGALLFLSGLPVTLMSHREFAGQNISENAKYLIATLSLRFRI